MVGEYVHAFHPPPFSQLQMFCVRLNLTLLFGEFLVDKMVESPFFSSSFSVAGVGGTLFVSLV